MSDITYKPANGTVWRNPNRPWQLSLIGYFCVVVGYIGIVWKIPSNSSLFISTEFLKKVNPSFIEPKYTSIEYVYSLATVLLGTLVSIIALAGGIGVLKLRPWGRKFIIIYATSAIFMTIVKCGWGTIFFDNQVDRIIQSTTQPVERESVERAQTTVITFGTPAELVAPIAMLTILNRRAIREVFNGRKKGLDQN